MSLSLNEKIFNIVRTQGPDACGRFLEAHGPGRDSDERHTLAHWRAALLDQEGKYADALSVVNAAASDFNCKSALALQRAQLLAKLGRAEEAVSMLREAPIAQESATYPGLAWEAAYFGCYLLAKQGQALARVWFDLIPEDFQTRIDGRPVAKSNLLDGKF